MKYIITYNFNGLRENSYNLATDELPKLGDSLRMYADEGIPGISSDCVCELVQRNWLSQKGEDPQRVELFYITTLEFEDEMTPVEYAENNQEHLF